MAAIALRYGSRMRAMLRWFVVQALFAAANATATGPPGEPVLPYTPGLDVTAMDRSADPCADFYQYACGGWQKMHAIPPDQTAWNVYRKMEDENLAFLRVVLEEAARSSARDAVTRQIGDYYAACMDEPRIETAGIAPLAGELGAIAALKSATEIPPLLARLQREASGRLVLFEATSQ